MACAFIFFRITPQKFLGPLCSRLIMENRKFALLFQARLRLYEGNTFKDFTAVEDAVGYLKEQQGEDTDISLQHD